MLLELAGEVLGIVESETLGRLRDGGSAHQELLGTVFHGRQPHLSLQAVVIVFPQQMLEGSGVSSRASLVV